MTKFIDFAPKRPRSTIEAHPVMKKPVAPVPRKIQIAPEKPQQPQHNPHRPQVASRGVRMDFVRRPATTPVTQVKTKAKKTIQVSINPQANSQKPVRHLDSQVTPRKPIRHLNPASKPTPKPAPIVEDDLDDVEPLMEDEELSLALADFTDDEEASPSLIDRLSKEASDLEDELNALDELDEISDDLEAEIADFVEEPKPLFGKSKSVKSPATSDANKYSLGGRSPFLSSVMVEKRPLSSFAPEEVKPLKSEAKTPLKNAYRAKIKQVINKDKAVDKSDSKPPRRHETTIISTPEPHTHNVGLAIAITLTVVLGALIGAVIYLVFFQ